MNEKLTFRLSADDQRDIAIVAGSMTNPILRPRVTVSEAVRAALRMAAETVKAQHANAKG